mgnify:FL=1
MTVFQGIFLGFLLGAVAVMLCIWLAGGSLYGEEEKAPGDAATPAPGQTKSDRNSITGKGRKVK